jgi:hypothetical protein
MRGVKDWIDKAASARGGGRISVVAAAALAGLVAMLAAGCGSGSSGDGLDCGEGTVEVAGACVPANPLVCGEGSTEIDGECVATGGGGATCGAGTTEVDGECVAASGLACGAGTTEVDGECVAASGLTCGEGTEEVGGACVAMSTVSCGDGTTEVDGQCVPESTLACGPGTEDTGGICSPTALVPGQYPSPLVHLAKEQGDASHMHIQEVRYRATDAKLFICSYDIAILDASNPQNMDWMAEGIRAETPSGSPRDPGCHRLDWSDADPDIFFTTHRKNIDFATYLSAWDMNTTCDPEDPEDCELEVTQILPALQEPGVSYEGLDYRDGLIYVALHTDGLAVYDFDGATFARIGEVTDGLDNAWDVVVHDSGSFAVVADGLAGVATVDISDPTAPVVLGHVPTAGEAEVVVLDGDTAYVAAGAAGLVVVDVSDPANPAILSVTDTSGPAIGLDYDSGKAFVAAWNDTRVYDVSDPAAPALIGGVRLEVDQPYAGDPGLRPNKTARTLGVAGYGDTAFIGNWWVPYTYQVFADHKAPMMVLPESYANVGFGPAAVGESRTAKLRVDNHGTAPLTLYNIWAENPAFTVTTPEARIPAGGWFDIEMVYTASTTDMETSVLHISSDDPLQTKRTAWLVGNQPGLGVGVAMPETTGVLIDGTDWSYMEDAYGKVTLLAYFATF